MKTSELLEDLPPVFAEDLLPKIHEALEASGKTIVVLDDDPTGTQTVFDVPVLTQLDADSIRDAIDEAPSVLFLLTNSRSLNVEETTKLHQDLGGILKEFGEDIIVISRSDSTLRGHFPLETNILREALGIPTAPTLFIPFFEAGGRLTVNDTHYVVEGETATPAHLTPFANDNTFPFTHSYLPDYIAEKTGGPVDVQSLSLAQLRSGDVSAELAALSDGCTCIVNAVSKKDLDVLSLALHQSARRFIIRSAASFVQSLGGITSRPPLDSWQMQDLDPNPNGGLIIVGSHVPKTSAQLADLLEQDVVPFELNVSSLLEGDSPSFPLDETLASGKTVVLFTSRDRIDGADNLAISKAVSGALVDLVKAVTVRPSFIIAKGGITSSDIATEALGIKKAQVLGQILPGVPVWTMGSETSHPGLAYVIFPGNVGDDTALTQAFQKLNS
ncbi:four-carbon acid sugar kinase family protein [Verrucomicrobiaceae bacterium 227]